MGPALLVGGNTRTLYGRSWHDTCTINYCIMETGVGSGSLAGLVARWTVSAVDADQPGHPFVSLRGNLPKALALCRR